MSLPQSHRPATQRFGEFELDDDATRLRRNGIVVPMEPKALALLQLLLTRAPRVVDKADIFAEIWKDTAVTDNALTRVVAQLRKALDDDPKNARYIETVATRGYRWIAALESTDPFQAQPETPVAEAPAERRPSVRARWTIGFAVLIVAVVIGTAIARRGTPSPAPATSAIPDAATLAGLRAVQLTSSLSYDGYVSFSPDGRSFAFSSDRTGYLEIYVQGIAAGSVPMPLTSNRRQNVQPRWSPDGQFIAYHDMAGNGIWIVPSRGGTPRKVSDFGSSPVWSPDGRRLAFQSLPVTQLNTLGVPGVPGTIAIVDADGGRPPVAITTPGIPGGPHRNPSWLDGEHVLFSAWKEGEAPGALYAVDLHGGAPVLVASHPRLSFDYALTPQDILFISRGTNAIWRLPRPAAGEISTDATPTGIQTVGPFINGLTTSADGRAIGWTSTEITGHVWSRAGDQVAAAPTVTQLTHGSGIRFTNPAPAGDGRLLMTGARPGAPIAMFMFNPDGEPRVITSEPSGRSGSQWLPGDREVVSFEERGSANTIHALDPETGRERQLFAIGDLPRPPRAQESSAAPPSAIAFSNRFDRAVVTYVQDGHSNLWLVGLRDMKPDGSLKQLTSEREGASYPAWSPDDRRVAYQCGDGINMHVCVVDVATGARTQVTDGAGQDWVNGWGRDNDTVLFAARRDAVWNIAAASVRTRTVRQLTNFTDAAGYVRYPRWDPANQRIVFERSEAVGRTWAVLMDGQAKY